MCVFFHHATNAIVTPSPGKRPDKHIDFNSSRGNPSLIMARITDIYRFPVKGLSAERLEQADLEAGKALANDRRFALALGSASVSSATIDWMAKNNFLMLLKNERLAQLEAIFDDTTDTLSILRGGRQVARGKLTEGIGRTMIEEFFGAFMGSEARGRIKVVAASENQTLADRPKPALSIINLASLRDIERVLGQKLNPLRLRGNICFESDTPWEEHDWIGRDISIGGARLHVSERIGRCGATNVNPETAERDINLLKVLQMGFSHTDCGILAGIESSAQITIGDEIKVL